MHKTVSHDKPCNSDSSFLTFLTFKFRKNFRRFGKIWNKLATCKGIFRTKNRIVRKRQRAENYEPNFQIRAIFSQAASAAVNQLLVNHRTARIDRILAVSRRSSRSSVATLGEVISKIVGHRSISVVLARAVQSATRLPYREAVTP